MKRRTFIGTVAAAAAALLALGMRAARAPARWVRAVRTGRYPGPVVELDPEDVKKPAAWNG